MSSPHCVACSVIDAHAGPKLLTPCKSGVQGVSRHCDQCLDVLTCSFEGSASRSFEGAARWWQQLLSPLAEPPWSGPIC